MREVNLLPCPFCGGKANVEEFDDGSGGVLCSECGFHAAHSRELWEKWNQRREGWSHAIERAIKAEAEAEVERYKLMVKSITGGLDEAIETVHYLEAENALLRKVADAAREFISSTGCNSKECKKCDPKYIGFCMWSGIGQSLAELDKESSHD